MLTKDLVYHFLLFFVIFDQKYICISLYPSLGNLSTQIAQIIEYDLWFWILPYRDKINRMEIFWHIRSFHGYWLAYFFLSVGNIFFCFVRGYFGDNKSFSILHSSQPENLNNFLMNNKDYLTTYRKRLHWQFLWLRKLK